MAAEPTKPTAPITALATTDKPPQLARPMLGLPTPDDIRTIEYLGQTYHASGLLPAGVKNWQAAVISIQAGGELGIPPTVAIREIYVVNSRPTCSAQLMMALIRAAHGPGAIRIKESTSDHCTIEYREPGWDGVSTLTFTIADAERAGLARKDIWKQYPRAMLRSRAVSEVARQAFPDAILGFYTPEEMGAPVDEDGRIVVTGEVIDVDHSTGEITVTPDPTVQAANTRLHAEANRHGIDHDMLHRWAVAIFDVASMNDLTPEQLDALGRKFYRDAAFAADFREKYAAPGTSDVVDAEVTDVEPEPTPEGQATLVDINDPDLTAAADRVQAAERARS
jgi:hypothetical protein